MDEPAPDPHRGKRLAGQILISLAAVVAILSLLGLFLGGVTLTGLLAGLPGAAVMIALPLTGGILLLRKAGPAPQGATTEGGRAPLSGIRIFFVIVGTLIMLFSGGCSLLLLGSYFLEPGGPENFVTPEAVLIVGGPPFAIGLVILLLALRAGRPRKM